MVRYLILSIALFSATSLSAQTTTVIEAKLISQAPTLRFTTDTEKALWNRAAGLLTSVPSGIVAQDDLHRFVTAEQISIWNKKTIATSPSLLANDVTITADRQFVSEADKLRWNKVTKIQSDFNILFEQVNDSTIKPVINIPSYNTYDRDRLPLPAPGKWIFILNADTKKINFRTNVIPWTTIWSD